MDIDLIYKKLTEAGNDWADKKSAYEALDENKKSVLSKFKLQSQAGSDAAKETDALANPEYVAYLNELNTARRAFLLAQVRFNNMNVKVDLMRSKEATERALLK